MMRKFRSSLPFVILSALLTLPLAARAQATMSAPASVLTPAEAGKLLPQSVFFAGQSAPTQLRNATGVRFAGGDLVLAVLVDSSGYSGGVQQAFQGYLLTEVPLTIGGHRLPAGAYGMGIVNGQLAVMDIGNHPLLHAPAMHDAKMHRPVPLQVLAGLHGGYRLCFGRECVPFRQAM